MNNLLIGLIIAIALSVLIFYAAKAGIEWESKTDSQLNIYDNWYGPIYINSDDKRIFLQKKRAGGYTVNLGNPIGILILLLFIGLMGWVIYLGS